tara:strand:- start:1388 stop:1795 length:408 start_codon:yes stop_codon:yes gene_type:complete
MAVKMKEHKLPPEEALLRLCLYCGEPMDLENYYWDLGYRHYHFLCVNCNQKVVVTQLTYTRRQGGYGLSRIIERSRRKKMDEYLDLPNYYPKKSPPQYEPLSTEEEDELRDNDYIERMSSWNAWNPSEEEDEDLT